jgi:hypothetical protein
MPTICTSSAAEYNRTRSEDKRSGGGGVIETMRDLTKQNWPRANLP